MSIRLFIICLIISIFLSDISAQNLPSLSLDPEWTRNISALVSEDAGVKTRKKRKLLVFDLATGYKHWVIPHTSEMIKIIGAKTGAFTVEVSQDISIFEKKNLGSYDAVVLNNTCSKGDNRNLFYDVLNEKLSEEEAWKEATRLEKNLIRYVEKGGGLVVLHGGITMLNTSVCFSELVGGSFDYHPPQQEVTFEVVNTDHPITKPFGEQPLVAVDEAYFLKGAYKQLEFEPLLAFHPKELKGVRPNTHQEIMYSSWIKTYGKGRVFFSAPSHNAQTFEQEAFLSFMLNGIQYATGDLILN